MRLFLDTNIFVEFIEHRKQYEPVSQIIDVIIEEQHTACISTGSLYTLTYLFECGLKIQDIHKPELTLRIRHLLAEVLNMFTIVPLAHANAETAVYDESFTDIEDSFQYRCALENHCHVLITINDYGDGSDDPISNGNGITQNRPQDPRACFTPRGAGPDFYPEIKNRQEI